MTETNTHTTRPTVAVAIALLVALSLGVGAIGSVAADVDSATGADLIVEQPTYVDSDVEERSEDGTPVYIAAGDEQRLYPQNFEPADVVEYGISGGGEASLSYDADLERYTFDPAGQTGSVELYWQVETERTVEEGNETRTVTDRETYDAIVRVDEAESVVTMPADEAESIREDADEWREWNATVTDVRESGIIGHALSSPASNQEVMQSMVNAYLTTRSPTHLLDGGATIVVIGMTTTLGGIFVFLLLKVPDAYAFRKLRAEVNRRRGVEQAEGELAARQEQVDLEARLEKFANADWQDLPSVTDFEAAEYRKVAETPLDMLAQFIHTFSTDTLKENRVRAMAQCGYVGQRDAGEDVAADGGAAVSLVRTDDILDPGETVADRDDLVDLSDPDEALIASIPDDDPELWDFPFESADFDLAELEDPLETASLPQLIEQFDFDEHGLEDERIGEIMLEFVEMVYNHPISDDEGRIDPVHYQLEHLFHVMQVASDRYQTPLASYWKQHIGRAIDEYSKDDELQSFLDDHRARTEDE